jgi:hypothetical protein
VETRPGARINFQGIKMDLYGLIMYSRELESIAKECKKILESDLNGQPYLFKQEVIDRITKALKDDQ